jgi:hypothetical protein
MIKQLILSVSFAFFLLVSNSCISGKKDKNQEFDVAKVHAVVTCAEDTNLTYALFLPPQYTKEIPSPGLILFDPHGDGLLPVNLFSAEAAKNGFIIAGSNNSKNGMPIEQTNAICHKILIDVSGRFNINKKAIYVGGFSGGSRVAGAAAITEGGIAGVIGCGAGLPNTNQKPVNPFSYLAVVGNQDFNFTEMQQLDESLDQAGYQHHLVVFDGVHQWPPKVVLPEIFTWLRFDAMRQKAIPVDRNEINVFIKKNDKEAGTDLVEGNRAHLQEIYIKMLHYLQGLTDVAPLQAEIGRLSGEKDIIAFRNHQTQLLEQEQELQRKYSPGIQQKNIEWWTKETASLRTQSEKPGNPEMSQVYKRLLGYLSLNCYMYSSNALKQNDLTAAAKYIEIYRLVDPTNAEHRYLAAKVAALNNNPDASFSLLKQAFDLGFKDINRLKSDADFKAYRQDERFKNLISGK